MSSPPTRSAPASVASFCLSPLAMTKTFLDLPRPLGITTVPRTIWSACLGSTPRLMWTSTVSSNLAYLYFGDLAAPYPHQKQWITGLSFFFASGAAATLIGKAPSFVPIILSLAVAAMTAYSIAVGLDRKITTMAKLHSAWNRISQEYRQ